MMFSFQLFIVLNTHHCKFMFKFDQLFQLLSTTYFNYCLPLISTIVYHLFQLLSTTYFNYCLPLISTIVYHLFELLSTNFFNYCLPTISTIVYHLFQLLSTNYFNYCLPTISTIVYQLFQLLSTIYFNYSVYHLFPIYLWAHYNHPTIHIKRFSHQLVNHVSWFIIMSSVRVVLCPGNKLVSSKG